MAEPDGSFFCLKQMESAVRILEWIAHRSFLLFVRRRPKKLLLRGQTVGAAEQELGLLDGQAHQQHGQAVDAQTEAAMGGQPYWKNSR